MSRSFSLSWKRFARVAVMLIALASLFLYMDFRSGNLALTSASIPLLCASFLAFFAYRWSRMRSDFAIRQLTETDFRRAPLKTIIGRPLYAILWFCFTLFLVFLPIAWWIHKH